MGWLSIPSLEEIPAPGGRQEQSLAQDHLSPLFSSPRCCLAAACSLFPPTGFICLVSTPVQSISTFP